jgi:hypothetical protein
MKMIFLPKGDPECVRWVRVEEPVAAAAPQSEPVGQDAVCKSETILDYVI